MGKAEADNNEKLSDSGDAVTTTAAGQAQANDDATAQATVRFAPDTKAAPVRVSYPPQPEAPLISQSRHKVGKFEPKRDLPIFFSVFAILLLVAFVSNDIGRSHTPEELKRMKKKPSIKEVKDLLVKATEEFRRVEEGRRRKTECGLFLGESTIPSAGLSWYSGRNFESGEVVLETGDKLGEDVFENELFLKHHPFMVNVERDQGQFRATRAIQQGEELFLSVMQHPHSRLGVDHPLFRNIPTAKDYRIAEDIFLIEADVLILNAPRKVKGNARLNTGHSNPKIGRDKTMELVNRVATLFNHRVANLLPKKANNLGAYFDNDRPYAYYVVQNRTIYWLEHRAHCMDDVVVRDDGLFAQRPVKKGATIVVAPLRVREKDNQCIDSDTCESPTSLCFGHSLSSIQLCPVTIASRMKYTDDPLKSNAVYQFSEWNTFNRVARGMRAHHVLTDLMTGLTMDIVASKNVDVGDEIILHVTDGNLAEYGIEMSDFKFPPNWCHVPEATHDSPGDDEGKAKTAETQKDSGAEVPN